MTNIDVLCINVLCTTRPPTTCTPFLPLPVHVLIAGPQPLPVNPGKRACPKQHPCMQTLQS